MVSTLTWPLMVLLSALPVRVAVPVVLPWKPWTEMF